MPGHYIYQNITGRNRNPYVEFHEIPGTGLGICFLFLLMILLMLTKPVTHAKPSLYYNKGESINGWSKVINWSAGFQYANKKVIWPATGWPNSDFFSQELNMQFLRFADVVLIYAEAANELGKTTEALKALEDIRFRARGNKTYEDAKVLPKITITVKTELRELIWKERRIELAFEGNRWFDLVRYEKVVPNYTTNILRGVGKANFVYNKYSKFPIPSACITSSEGVLTQNDQWK